MNYLLPLGPPTGSDPPAYQKSQPIEGQVSYYTYMAPEGRTPTELFRNYKQEFARLNFARQAVLLCKLPQLDPLGFRILVNGRNSQI